MRILGCFILVAIVGLVAHIAMGATADAGRLPRYVIATDVNDKDGQDPYAKVVAELTKLRHPAAVLNVNPDNLKDLFSKLRTLKPEYVAFVVYPERIEDNFVGAIFEGLTTLDDDPFLDCGYGYITGATAKDALALIRSTAAAQVKPGRIRKKFVAIAHTFAEGEADLAPFATQQAERYEAYGYKTAGINPKDNCPEWEGKADREIQKLNGASLVFLAGHGTGDMSCAIPGNKLGHLKLHSAIIVNGTCHSAVTLVRHDSKDRFWTIETTRIDPRQSVCMNFIKAGAIGQFASTASSSWMNVAFAISKFFNEGLSLGEALQQSLNDKIRAASVKQIKVIPFRDGEKSPQALGEEQNPGGIQTISRVILIGDPAYRPFPAKPGPLVAQRQSHSHGKPSPVQKRVKELIEQLSDPKAPGFAALNELIRIGTDAVPGLIEELKTSDNWQIPKALGAIGDPRAVKPLIEKLAQSNWSPMREVIAEGLQLLTHKDFGTNAKAWRRWWKVREKKGFAPSKPAKGGCR